MRRMPFILVALIASLNVTALAQAPAAKASETAEDASPWQRLPDMPVPVLAADVSIVGARVCVSGGIHQLGSALDQVQTFDLKTLTWLKAVKLNEGRCMHAQVTLDDRRILVAGGQTGRVKPIGPGLKAIASCEVIDVISGESKTIAPLPRVVAEPTGHRLADGRAIIIGGESAMVYDPKEDKWARGIGLRDPRQAHYSVLLRDGRIVVIGGVNLTSIELIDVKAGASKMLASELPHFLDDTCAIELPDGRVWILGGQHSKTGNTTERTWLLDISDPRKSVLTDGPVLGIKKGVGDACVVQADERWAILAGGESEMQGDIELATARLLDLKEVKVYALPDMRHPHDDAVAVPFDRGMLMIGGFLESKMEWTFGEAKKTVTVPTAVPVVERISLPKDPRALATAE
ncbi:MAG: hypothetical protein WD768_02610 [Phycisphaeraceae bacterium]